MRSRCLAERTFGIGLVAPPSLRASAVAETGKPTGTTGPVRSRRGGRSPTAARGEGGSERGDERAHEHADARLSRKLTKSGGLRLAWPKKAFKIPTAVGRDACGVLEEEIGR